MEQVDSKQFPILARLLAEGHIFVEREQYVGRTGVPSIMAPEGLVGLGCVGDEEATESYLRKFPSPQQW